LVPSPWARLHLSRPFQSGPPSFAIYVLLLLSTMGREERQKAMASSEIGRVLCSLRKQALALLLWGGEVAVVEDRGLPVVGRGVG